MYYVCYFIVIIINFFIYLALHISKMNAEIILEQIDIMVVGPKKFQFIALVL